jgi:hypothetical protein
MGVFSALLLTTQIIVAYNVEKWSALLATTQKSV